MAITESTTTSPTTDIQPELLSTQADEQAAVAMLEHAFRNVSPRALKDVSFADITSAFARHRLTSTTPTLGDMVMVPRRLTQAMREAATEVRVDDGTSGFTALNWEEADEVFAAMLSAAPASPISTSVANEGALHPSDRLRALVEQVEAGQFDELEAVADKWVASAGIQRMSNAICSVFEKYAPQDVMDRFREKVAATMHLSFVEGAAQGVMQISLSPALDNTAVEGLTDEQYKRLGYKLTAPLSDWFIRNGDRTNPSAFINTDPAYFGMECGSFIAGIVRASTVQTEKA